MKCPVRGCHQVLPAGRQVHIDAHLAVHHPNTAAGKAAAERNRQRLADGSAD